ncbi:MAG TPA: hypothetical protein VF458_19765 [Ktedonobacteraceae bacterium]
MKDDFNTRKSDAASDAHNADLPADFDEIEISELPPDRRSHYLLRGLNQTKQRLLAAAKYVSRATWKDITQATGDEQAPESPIQANSNEFELEFSELPPTRRSHFLLLKLKSWLATRAEVRRPFARKSTTPARQRLAVRALSMLGMLVVLLALLFGSAPELRTSIISFFAPARASTTVSYVSTDLSGIDSNMPVIVHPFGTPPASYQTSPGAIPGTCPHISPLQYFTSPLDPPGLGDGPVWISGFNGPSAVLDRLAPFAKPGQGWYETLTIFIQKSFVGDIVLQGNDQHNNQFIWLSKKDPLALADNLIYNLDDGSKYTVPFPKWEMTSIVISVPAAGCYSLQATWPNHEWKRYFAAGE